VGFSKKFWEPLGSQKFFKVISLTPDLSNLGPQHFNNSSYEVPLEGPWVGINSPLTN